MATMYHSQSGGVSALLLILLLVLAHVNSAPISQPYHLDVFDRGSSDSCALGATRGALNLSLTTEDCIGLVGGQVTGIVSDGKGGTTTTLTGSSYFGIS